MHQDWRILLGNVIPHEVHKAYNALLALGKLKVWPGRVIEVYQLTGGFSLQEKISYCITAAHTHSD